MLPLYTLYERTSTVRMDRKRKLGMVSSSMATKMAKKQNDPLYRKLKKAKQRYEGYKKSIQRKYGQRGSAAARKSMR